MKSLAIFLLLWAFATSAQASADEADFGFGMKVSVGWRLQVQSAQVHALRAGSEAESKGVQNGDLMVSIEDCEIPGCKASRAQDLLDVPVGTTRNFRLRRPDGSEYAVELTARRRGDPGPSQ